MKSFRIQNLRSLEDTKEILVKPLTVLVGRNSIGKSTLLRSIPLLKQSVETARSGPILWFGDYVDFGSIATAIRNDRQRTSPQRPRSVLFEFNVRLHELQRRNLSSRMVESDFRSTLQVSQSDDSSGCYLSRFLCAVAGIEAEIQLDEQCVVRDFCIDGYSIKQPFRRTRWQLGDSALLPENIVRIPATSTPTHTYVPGGRTEFRRSSRFGGFQSDAIGGAIAKLVSSSNDENFANYQIQNELSAALSDVSSAITARQVKRALIKLRDRKRDPLPILASITESDEGLDLVRRLILASRLIDACSTASRDLTSFFLRSSYTGPMRANAQRFYRGQELAVQEVDSRGENFPAFIRSLSDDEFREFSAFLSDYLSVRLHRRDHNGLLELFVLDGPYQANLVDVGFGYSQVLPVVAQLWAKRTHRHRRKLFPSMVAIEQPELHLHPAHQARLADMFAGILKLAARVDASLSLMIETHSEAIINRLGTLVANRSLNPEDVQVIVFERDDATHQVNLRRAYFDEHGGLNNWPYGFFLPEVW